jgi:branched-chain amino acid transport system permease protein
MGILMPLSKTGDSLWRLQFREKLPYYYVALASWGRPSPRAGHRAGRALGHLLAAIRENEDAAEASGVDTLSAKLVAMAVSAFLTAVGGTLLRAVLHVHRPGPRLRPVGVGRDPPPSDRGRPGTLLGPLLGSSS